MACAAGVSLVLAGCSGGGDDGGGGGGVEEITLTLTSPSGEDQHPDLHEWMDLITERTDGAVQFETFYDGSLCALAETSGCISDGRADLGFHSSSYNPADFPITEVGSLPFQTWDIQAQAMAMQDLQSENEAWQAEYEAVNQHLLYYSPVGAHQLVTSEQYESLDDLAGLSIRSSGGQAINLNVLGANPVSIAPVEVYESVQRGVLDGASYPLELAAQSGVAEVAPYVHDLGKHTGAMVMLMWSMNLDTWESLSSEVQQVFTDTSREVLSTIVEDHVIPATHRACEVVDEQGGEFVEIGTEAEGEEFQEEAEPVHLEQWSEAAGASLDDPQAFLDRYHELMEEHASGEERTPGQMCRDHLS